MQTASANNDAVCRILGFPKNQGNTWSESRSEIVATRAIPRLSRRRLLFFGRC